MKTLKIQLCIPEPCPANWEEMTSVSGGRYCNQCSKTVKDFAGMTKEEIQEYLQENKSVCGRVDARHLGNLPARAVLRRNYRGVWWKGVLAGLALISVKIHKAALRAGGFSPPLTASEGLATKFHHYEIMGRILNERREPISGARIIVRSGMIAIAETLSDHDGRFQTKAKGEHIAHNQVDMLVDIKGEIWDTNDIYLGKFNPDFEITVNGKSRYRSMDGMLVGDIVSYFNPFEIRKKTEARESNPESLLPAVPASEASELTALTSVTLFPNPASSYFSLRFDAFASVSLQITDMQGKQVFMHQYEHTEHITEPITWSSGTYLLRLTDRTNGQLLKSFKLIVQ